MFPHPFSFSRKGNCGELWAQEKMLVNCQAFITPFEIFVIVKNMSYYRVEKVDPNISI